MTSGYVFDVSAVNFQTDVLLRSQKTPVLLDFWADWCSPCKTLGPVLEALAEEYGGAFVLGKVDAETNPELAQAFGVRSIPFVCLLAGGRPVDAFTGALPEAEVRAFLSRCGIESSAPSTPDPAADPDSPAGRLAAAAKAVLAGDAASASAALEGIADEDEQAVLRDWLRDGLGLLTEPIDATDGPAAEALLRARDALGQGRLEDAMEAVLDSVEHDRSYREGLARRAMLLLFALHGDEDVCGGYRRRLATLLY